jgi:hypothetical protein
LAIGAATASQAGDAASSRAARAHVRTERFDAGDRPATLERLSFALAFLFECPRVQALNNGLPHFFWKLGNGSRSRIALYRIK